MKNNYFILIILIIVIATAFILKIFGPSNRWICQNGEWVKLGRPKTEKPVGDCYDPTSMHKEMMELEALYKEMEKDNNKENISIDSVLGPNNELKDIEEKLEADSSSDSKNSPILLSAPMPSEIINSPYQLRGFAPGNWYFEASFPIILKSEDGFVIAETYAQAQSDWMTSEMVPFIAELNYIIDSPQEAMLIFKKDNPSGLPENDSESLYEVRLN